ncbi:peptide deformylase [Paracoccus sp. R86501]|uniref:peptide deformylase n=1 Tax=Paracoccus sp. R86501 TaxID=3101711 RepID=UPI00366B0DC0
MADRHLPAAPIPPVLTGDLAAGKVRGILRYPDPVLFTRCDAAGYLPQSELRDMAADLLATMYDANGRGLAAPQIGISRRIFVMDAGWKDGQPDPLVMLDPEIVWRSAETGADVEACLSIPDQPVSVTRPLAITIGWYDLQGRHQTRPMSGAAARIAQHEADHLDGRLILKDIPPA